MFDIKSFYEAKSVQDAIDALVKDENAEIISGGTDVLIRCLLYTSDPVRHRGRTEPVRKPVHVFCPYHKRDGYLKAGGQGKPGHHG